MESPADHEPSQLRHHFIEAMSHAVTGVTVVATASLVNPEDRVAQTVSAMCSVSADPPMLLVCLNRQSRGYHAVAANRVFSVNILRADQQRISRVFAGRPGPGDQPYDFAAAAWETAVTGSPLLVGAVARFDCQLDAIHLAGTHGILIGRVVAASSASGAPLVYARRNYGELVSFPHRPPDTRAVPAGFVGDEPDPTLDDLILLQEWDDWA